ncbi:hypothetical protein P7D22_14065 [Lichenihabitans sp. Uapishka_5]|uniref:hypothetical protein n=1 Tax=Lichenihabitans sp. Uapishka_5 TaxID=3037302 RepID=UPI0029E81D28|nr:hypothetical protein [Lichenihabitans sp. Uapishka_5]MDX7952297.1 hypothetical protein [Lichenihabitans sp. Uapishka_5]
MVTGKGPTDAARRASAKTRKAQAVARTADLVRIVIQLREDGIVSSTGIAKALTSRGIPTAKGSGRWQAVQVQRLFAKADA